MKKTAALIAALAVAAAALTGCRAAGETFTATIIDVRENSISVIAENAGFDEATVGVAGVETDFEYVVGQTVEITYSGDVMETYPVQLTATAVRLVSQPEARVMADGVTMDIAFTSATACTLTIYDGNEAHTYGRWYCIERLENGEWVTQPVAYDGNYAFTAEGYGTSSGVLVMEEDFGWLYGELPAGTYRLVKDVYMDGATRYVAAEFAVTA